MKQIPWYPGGGLYPWETDERTDSKDIHEKASADVKCDKIIHNEKKEVED